MTLHQRVLLLGFPMELWILKALEELGSPLGKLVYVDESLLVVEDKCMASVLVKLDLSKGLLSWISIS